MSLGSLPGIEDTARKIFEGYTSMKEAFADIEDGQALFIANKLGLKNGDGGIIAINVYKTLIEYKEELIFAEKFFDIYTPLGDKIKIAITGGVI